MTDTSSPAASGSSLADAITTDVGTVAAALAPFLSTVLQMIPGVGPIVTILQDIVQFVPDIPEVVHGIETAVGLVQSGTAPTAAQQSAIDAALDAAHQALQNG